MRGSQQAWRGAGQLSSFAVLAVGLMRWHRRNIIAADGQGSVSKTGPDVAFEPTTWDSCWEAEEAALLLPTMPRRALDAQPGLRAPFS